MPDRRLTPRIDPPATAGTLFSLIRDNTAITRKQLARATGMAASTVSLRVETLLEAGLVEESGTGAASGGRQPRLLRVRGEAGVVVSVSLGTHHLAVLCCDLLGAVLRSTELEIDVADGPEAVLHRCWSVVQTLLAELGSSAQFVRGLVLGIGAPADPRIGGVASSAQLPGWDQVDLVSLMSTISGVRVIVANDANLLAITEQNLAQDDGDNLLAIKLGSRIGSGIISNSHLHLGASGAGGEISHTPTTGISSISCSCGVPNCLESVAGGSAIIARLRADGYHISTTADLVRLASAGDIHATEVIRGAGVLIGEVLAEVVNFFNPRLVVFGGSLSVIPVFVAAVRGIIFQRCLPIVTDILDVRVGSGGADAEAKGGISLILSTILTAEEIDRALASRTGLGAQLVRESRTQ